MQYFTVLKMERKLQKFYNFFYSIAAFPYDIVLNSADNHDSFIVLKKNKHYNAWILFQFSILLHTIRTLFSFIITFHYYMDNHQLLRLMFHLIWTISFVIILSQQLSFILSQNEMMQQGNGTFALQFNLANGKYIK